MFNSYLFYMYISIWAFVYPCEISYVEKFDIQTERCEYMHILDIYNICSSSIKKNPRMRRHTNIRYIRIRAHANYTLWRAKNHVYIYYSMYIVYA